MSETKAENNLKKEMSIIDPLKCKYMILSLVAAVISVILYASGFCDLKYMTEIISAAAIIYLTLLVQNIYLKKHGFSSAEREKEKKHIESRITGTFSDISGIGATMGAIAGVASAFADIYIIDGGIFMEHDLMMPILMAAVKAFTLGSSIAMITSPENLWKLFYIVSVRNFEPDRVKKNISRISHYSDVMRTMRGACAVRLIAAIGMTIVTVVVAVTGTGAPYSCLEAALIYLTALICSTYIPKAKNITKSEEKTTLWSKQKRAFCIVNVAVFCIISFAVMFTFPFRSVFTVDSYSDVYVFEYDVEVESTIDAVSVPVNNAENSGLFSALFAITAALILVSALFSDMSSSELAVDFFGKDRLYSICLGGAIAAAYVIIKGFIIPEAVFGPIAWLVVISVLCLFVSVDLVYRLIEINRNRSNKAN